MKIEIDTRIPATEDEASRLWCPFSRVAFVGQGVMNRVSSHYTDLAQRAADRGDRRDLDYYKQQARDCNCLASRCMAWRWAGYNKRGENDEATGFCGLVGKPDLTT
jgi:hypothetical protein